MIFASFPLSSGLHIVRARQKASEEREEPNIRSDFLLIETEVFADAIFPLVKQHST